MEARSITFVPLREKGLYSRGDIREFGVGEFGKVRNSKAFAAYAFGVREVSLFVTEMPVAFLKMKGQGIILTGLYTSGI